jgi:hypothetical protein
MGLGLPICRSIIARTAAASGARQPARQPPSVDLPPYSSGSPPMNSSPIIPVNSSTSSTTRRRVRDSHFQPAALRRHGCRRTRQRGRLRAAPRAEVCSCLLLDVRLQGVSGLDFQAELNRDGVALPIIFMTGMATSRCRCGR